MNDLFNDGINITTFMRIFQSIPSFDSIYEEKLRILTDQSHKIFSKPFKITSFLNLKQKLSSIPEINEFILQFGPQYTKYKSIISLFGPKVCRNFDLDYQKVKKLLEYVFVNAENDGILAENVLKIMEIPVDWVPKVSKILAKYDGIETVSDLFSKLNVLPQYYDFIEKVNLLKIPRNRNDRFFSINRVIDCQTSFIVLLDAADQKVRDIYGEIKPFLPKNKPFNYQKFFENAPKYIEGIEMYMKLKGYPTPINVTNIHKEKVPLKKVVENLTALHKTFKNVRYSSNLKFFFDYLNIDGFWLFLRDVAFHLSRDDSLCDFFDMSTQRCNKLFVSIVEKSRLFVSKSSFAKSTPKYVTKVFVPLLKSLSLSISDFLSYMYKLSVDNDDINDVNFTNFVSSISKLYASIIKYVERIDTKKNILNTERAHFVCDLIKNNGCFELLIDPHFSIVVEMLKSGAESYVDESTTFETIVKSIQPTTFLNFYRTFRKMSEVKSLKISRLSNALCYDDEDSSKTSFNDVFPIKTIVDNLEKFESLVDEMNNNLLSIESISKCLGIKKEKLKDFFTKYLDYCISFYVGAIIGATKGSIVPKLPKYSDM